MDETVAPPPASLTKVAVVAPLGETRRAISVRSNEHDERSNIDGTSEIVTMKLFRFSIGYSLPLRNLVELNGSFRARASARRMTEV
jgi:hypothetical protein